MERLEQHKKVLNSLNDKMVSDSVEKELYEKQEKEKRQELLNTRARKTELENMKLIVVKGSDKARNDSTILLETVATKSSTMTMDDDLTVKIVNSTKRGVPNSDVVVLIGTDENQRAIDPCAEDGGGLSDIIAISILFALRILAGAKNSAPIFLDEPCKAVSSGLEEKSSQFLKELADYSGIQTFIVTHELQHLPNIADTAYRVELKDGKSNLALI